MWMTEDLHSVVGCGMSYPFHGTTKYLAVKTVCAFCRRRRQRFSLACRQGPPLPTFLAQDVLWHLSVAASVPFPTLTNNTLVTGYKVTAYKVTSAIKSRYQSPNRSFKG